MSGGEQNPWDDETLAKLGDALGYDPVREPRADRVAALRSQAERIRAARAGVQSARPETPPSATVLRFPRRRAFLVGGIAASVGAVAGVGVSEIVRGDGQAGPPTEQIAFAAPPAGVETDARLINHTWGVELMLDIRGLPAGQTYSVVYADTAGGVVGAGSFLSVADRLMNCRFNAALVRSDVAAIAVLDATNTEVMRAQLA